MQRAKDFFKKEPVFVIAFLCAVLSMFLVPPSADYIGYIDFRVLELLFCLMAAVAGMQQEGVFLVLAQKILAGKKSLRLLTLTLVMLPFFSSMLITNDVALITFVPFAVLVLELTGQTKHLAWVVTLQTIAANIGSMLTPVGNPQNLYLSSFYQLAAGDFFAVTIPIVLLSFVLLALCCIAGIYSVSATTNSLNNRVSRERIFSSAPNIFSSYSFNSWVIYRSAFTNVCFLIHSSGTLSL